MNDFLNKPVKPGDHVVWAAGGRGTHGIRQGTVIDTFEAYGRPHVKVRVIGHGRGGTMRADQVVVV